MYMMPMPMPIFLPSSDGKSGSCKNCGNNKFFVYGILMLVVGVFTVIVSILLELFFNVGLFLKGDLILVEPKVSLVGFLWILIMFCLFVASIFYKNQTDKEIFESIGRDFIRLCNLSIIGFVVVIGIMVYDIVTLKEVITQTKANIIMGSAIVLNIIRYSVCAKRKKNTKKMRKNK